MSIFCKKRRKKIDLSYFVYVHLNVSKTKPVAARGHPLLLLLIFQNKSCLHNAVGTCTEILQHTSSQNRMQLNKFRFIKFRIKPLSLERFRTIMKHKMDNKLSACYFFTNMNSVLTFQIIFFNLKIEQS